MTDYLKGFTSSELRGLYSQMMSIDGMSDGLLDRSIPSIQYSAQQTRNLGRPDHIIQSSELFQAVTTRSGLHQVYRRFARERLPWQADHSQASRTALRDFDAMVADWRSNHPRGTERQLAQQVFRWLTDRNGFGMVHDPTTLERSFNMLVNRRRGDCTEFIFALMVFYERLGFSVSPQWIPVDMDGNPNEHVALKLSLGGQDYLVDPIFRRFNAPHQVSTPMSRRELLAWYWNNRAVDLQNSNTSRAERFFERAVSIDAYNPYIRDNRARFFHSTHRPNQARQEIREALRLYPNFPPAESRMGDWSRDAGRLADATRHYLTALRGNSSLEGTRVALIEVLLRRGRSGQARTHLNRLKAQNPHHSSIPRLESLVTLGSSAGGDATQISRMLQNPFS